MTKEYQPYEQRVLDEYKELSEKVSKLYIFLAMSSFERLPANEQKILRMQHYAMVLYKEILESRIAGFKE